MSDEEYHLLNLTVFQCIRDIESDTWLFKNLHVHANFVVKLILVINPGKLCMLSGDCVIFHSKLWQLPHFLFDSVPLRLPGWQDP